jgi:hypothetical protein
LDTVELNNLASSESHIKRIGSELPFVYSWGKVKHMKKAITQKVCYTGWHGSTTVEELKPEYFVDSGSLAASQSELAKRETNDCVVRAFMSALDLPYDRAHGFVKKNLQRKFGKGTYTTLHIKHVLGKTKNGMKLKPYGCHPDFAFTMKDRGFKTITNPKYKNKKVGYTLKSFIEAHPKGRYFVILERHAVAVVNGVLYGNRNEQRSELYRRVNWVVKCEEK